MSQQIQLRRDTAANWTSINPTLASGEIGVETDTLKFKVGNGSTAWTSLAYSGGVTSVTGTSPIASSGGLTPDISIADAIADGVTKGAATFNANDFNSASGVISIDYTNGQSASSSNKGFLTSADWSTFNGKVTSVSGTSPIASSGGATPAISIADAVADGATKGAATFNANDFDSAAGVISIDYANGQSASGSTTGFLTSADWTTFNNKQATITTGAVDNAVLRADGTGGSTLQNSGIIIDDAIISFSTVTGDATTDVITVTGSAFSNTQPVRFTSLTGGSGLNTTTNYYVREASGATFKVETSIGGGAVNFTTNITAGTLVNGHSITTNVAISENTSATNSDFVVAPKGFGAFILGPKPDGATFGGNARGSNAIDLQLSRTGNTQVASGANSLVVGVSNTASGAQSTAFGNSCTSSGLASTAIGTGCTASGNRSFAGGGNSSATNSSCFSFGDNAQASANNSNVFGGYNNTANNTISVVVGGGGNLASGQASFCAGGLSTVPPNVTGNTASGQSTSCPGGYGALADRHGMYANASGTFAARGDAQRGRFTLRCKTTTNSAVEMALDGSTTYLGIPSGKVMSMLINISGIKSDGSSVAHYVRQYAVKNVGGTSTEVYAPIVIGADNAAGTTIALSANNADDTLRITVTGIAAETWRWVASVDAVEIAYGV